MTKEEYLSKTGIRNEEEARARLMHLRILFAVVFTSMIIVQGGEDLIDENTYLLFGLGYLCLLIFFVVYCVKVIKLTRDVTSANAFWSIIFAPISWFWFYPEITKPLKIIIGEMEPPEKLPTKEERSAIREGANKRFWKTIKIVIGFCAALLVLGVIWAVIDSQDKSTLNQANSTENIQTQEEVAYHYVSSDAGFEIDFPTQPKREEVTEELGDELGSVTMLTYQSVKENNSYFVFFYKYSNPAVGENSPDYDIRAGLEGVMNGMVNGIEGATLTDSNFTNFQGHQAIDYKISAEGEDIEGIIFMNGKHLYNVAVDYVSTELPKPSFLEFLRSFKFRI